MAGRALKRWIACVALAALAFAQASVAVSSCRFERGSLSDAMGAADHTPECEAMTAAGGNEPANQCFAHCTSDLQTVGAAVALVRGSVAGPVLAIDRTHSFIAVRTGLDSAPPGTPPPRILLHSFLI